MERLKKLLNPLLISKNYFVYFYSNNSLHLLVSLLTYLLLMSIIGFLFLNVRFPHGFTSALWSLHTAVLAAE